MNKETKLRARPAAIILTSGAEARIAELMSRAPEGAIAVQAERDEGPGYLPEEREVPDDDVWAFQISGLTRFIETELALMPPGEDVVEFRPKGLAPVRLNLSLVEKLTQSWTGTAARGQTRLPAGHRLDCVIGLH